MGVNVKNKKAAMELSINFVVGLILGILMFSLGLVLVYNILSGTEKIKQWSLPDNFNRLAQACVEDNKKVCILNKVINLKTREHMPVGLVINNVVGEEKKFKVFVNFAKGYLEDETEVNNVDLTKWTFTDFNELKLENNKYEIVNIPFLVPKGTKKGTYVFNVNVCFDSNVNPSNKCPNSYASLYDITEQIMINVK